MADYSCTRKLAVFHLFIISCYCIFNFSYKRITPNFQVRAVNLGGWLLSEGWITPYLFDGIPNKDFLDGTTLQFRSVTVGKYLYAELGGGTIIVANASDASEWATFKIWRINSTSFNLRVCNREFVGIDETGKVVAVENKPGFSETFEIVRNCVDPSRVRIKSPNGFFLQVKREEVVRADSEGKGGWGDDDPSVFILSFTGRLQGEFQITNGYGPILAPQIMREHWRTYIVEEDFKFIAHNGLNAVRIPVGWWIAKDPMPPKPFVGGSLHTLDNAFLWAMKYRLKVIICLHALPGSQNPWEHGGGRDGTVEWGKTDDTIQQTVAVIDFLTARYVKNPSLYAVELINEPAAPVVSLESLKKYYEAGYNAVRKHSSDAYVIMCNRVGHADPTELLSFASDFKGSVVDVHYYNVGSDIFFHMSIQQNLDYIFTNRSAQLNNLTIQNGPLILVGEWVAEWELRNTTKLDYQKFVNAQLQVYGQATFGWAYWSLKNVNDHWNMEWMIKNGYIKL